MNEGGVKAWEPHQVQNPLAFSDDDEEDLLDFMYKYKAPRRTEFPLEVHGVGGCGVERVFAQRALPWRTGAPVGSISSGTQRLWSAWSGETSLHQTGRTSH